MFDDIKRQKCELTVMMRASSRADAPMKLSKMNATKCGATFSWYVSSLRLNEIQRFLFFVLLSFLFVSMCLKGQDRRRYGNEMKIVGIVCWF